MLNDDGDIVKALGYVSLYGAYLEEQVEDLVNLLEPIKKYKKGFQISDKIIHTRKAIRLLSAEDFQDLLNDLCTCLEIFQDRNELLHGRIYAGLNRPDTLKSNKPDVFDRPVTSFELYRLANEMYDFRIAIYRPMIFQLPKAIAGYSSEIA